MTARTEVLEKANSQTSAPSSQITKAQSLSPPNARHNPPRVTRSTSNQSSQDSNESNPIEKIPTVRATWTGKILLITGLSADQFPVGPPSTHVKLNGNGVSRKGARGNNARSSAPSRNLSPAKGLRTSLKRKRSGTNASVNGVYGDSQAPSDESRRASQANSLEGEDEDQDDSPEAEEGNGDAADGHEEAQAGSGSGNLDKAQQPAKPKRRRRGQRLLEQAVEVARAPSPQLPLVPEEDDKLEAIDLPAAFLSHSPTPDPDDPDDVATKLYKQIYEPLTKAEAFVTALSKINPAQRRTENLIELAANTAAVLRIWQDEYLEIDRLTAPHAPIPRKPATGNRQLIDSYLFEDQKEADIYDYILDMKKIGHQNPIAQKIVRDASGRELRMRGPKTRVTADHQLLNAANISEDDIGRRHRARKPVSKYDGIVPEEQRQRRKRGIGQVSESVEGEGAVKRGRWTNGRGGRGRSRGGRGGASRLLDKRIREMREESVGTAVSYGDDDSGSDVGALDPYSRDGSLAPSQDGQDDYDGDDVFGPDGERRKGRPKGSKNLHFRSDKGIPKGPRPPKTSTGTPESNAGSPALVNAQPVQTSAHSVNAKPLRPGQKPPKSEKRSESMTIWWAKRKAAAAEARRKEAEAAGLPPPVEKPRSRAPKTSATDKAQAATKSATQAAPRRPSAGSPHTQQPPPATTSYTLPPRYSNGPSPPNPHVPLGPLPPHSQPMTTHHPGYSQPPSYPPPMSAPLYHSQGPLPPSILADPRRGTAGSPPVNHDRLPSLHDIQVGRGSIFRDPMQRDPRDPRDHFASARDRFDPTRPYDRRDVPPPQHGFPPRPGPPPHPTHGQFQQALHGVPPPPPPTFLGYPPPPPGMQQDPRYRQLGQQGPPRDGRDGRRY
ncbi:hypothetical protein BDZ85DRAFT_259192 [Elsinoe ampelina]|uniref:Uncharacterized protein n=1 Tax=Elsinoe ampelina TaxID=302913 RepID=A0A6A6GGQ3_9PEZI|nr:hypothetical protein BDZ85DRAFT_259192 [Elsinoe ampelina]